MMEYISLPWNIKADTSPAIERCKGAVEESIGNFLELVVFTPKGSFDADPDFGFEYWNYELANIDVREFNNSYIALTSLNAIQNNITKTQCEESLCQSILTYEPRLKQPEVKIELENNTKVRRGKLQSKYEMRIHIAGYIDDGMGLGRRYEKKMVFFVEPTAKKTLT